MQDFALVGEILRTLIGAGSVSFICWHKSADKRRELVDSSLVFYGIIRGDFYLNPCWSEHDGFTNSNHAEFKA